MRKLLIVIAIIFLIYLFRNLNPFSNQMFSFHDMTQYPRISQYALSLKNLQIPPRMAPDFALGLSYPVFNFYAPGVYILAGFINLIGFDLITTVKIILLLALIVGFIGSFKFLKTFFDEISSFVGAALYISCLYIPLNIFVRGNLGEVWFIALFPWILFTLYKVLYPSSVIAIPLLPAILVLSATLLVHNLLSILVIPIILFFGIWSKRKKDLLIILVSSFLLTSFYYLPLIFENSLTYAQQIASKTNYSDHFLCLGQLWQSSWLFGGSTKECVDGMSFMLGKIQIILFLLGIITLLISSFWQVESKTRRVQNPIRLFFLILTIGSLLMTLPVSKIFWQLIPYFKIIQFPWRFLAFSIIGFAFFGAYFVSRFPGKYKPYFLIIILLLTVFNGKYFYGKNISSQKLQNNYLSEKYLTEKAALEIPEYFPKTASYEYWKIYRGKVFLEPIDTESSNYTVQNNSKYHKEVIIKVSNDYQLNILYFPYWQIKVNDRQIIPNQFDPLGRPILQLKTGDNVIINYQQTMIEKIGDMITLITIILLVIVYLNYSIRINK